ncbi:MAG TPA: hypothetical protein VK541_04015 [Pedobacter sp.]|uniref:hypothetical protein n=1 Tax=Pedobacter sp. TaxID=1411316 RepID=UPI002D064141|nr:hypothetical protein [Pedobacter sp.]HMI01620.1 hypothetical protein [Pedobacter sp.]
MSCFTEYTISTFLESKTVLQERILALDILIDKAILLLADNIDGAAGNISSYELDDGQVRIKTGYRSMADIESGIKSLERMKQLYINRLYGRSVTLRDSRTFR